VVSIRCGFSKTLKSQDFSIIDSFKTYDFSTIYAKIPHDKLKCRLFQTIDNCFLNTNGTRKYKFVVIGKQDSYFVRHHSDSPYKYSEGDIKSMFGFSCRQSVCSLWRPGLPTIRWHSYGHQFSYSYVAQFV
jgi:hypothetical protein